ncbi:uncharacterized protein LOC127289512 [Leptopilina boulardi]|uniref:uncharacterized protein LOC127289512 n=1 Tax=Leptopilina boulardi TaxID=63433 RepID=UPI0021F5E0BF|nr:uncharacterized protein LOC127289512 [Leptopilina boulardi]
MSNIDCRGVKRGRCACGDCEEFLGSSKVECAYCNCVPAKHDKLENDNATSTKTNTSVSENTETATIWEPNLDVNEEIEQLSEESNLNMEINDNENNAVDVISNLPEEYKTQWVALEDIIPHNFIAEFHFDIMTELFKNTEIEKVHFCKIVRLISEKLVESKKTNSTYILMAGIIATRRFPGLRGNNAEAIHVS